MQRYFKLADQLAAISRLEARMTLVGNTDPKTVIAELASRSTLVESFEIRQTTLKLLETLPQCQMLQEIQTNQVPSVRDFFRYLHKIGDTYKTEAGKTATDLSAELAAIINNWPSERAIFLGMGKKDLKSITGSLKRKGFTNDFKMLDNLARLLEAQTDKRHIPDRDLNYPHVLDRTKLPITIGRGDEADVKVAGNEFISREQAMVVYDAVAGKFMAKLAKSDTNTVAIERNRRRIELSASEPIPLQEGDYLVLTPGIAHPAMLQITYLQEGRISIVPVEQYRS